MVELQKIAGIVPRPARPFGVYAPEAGTFQIKAVNKRVDESNRVVGANIVFHCFRN